MPNKGTMSMSNNPSSNLTFQNYEQAIAWQKEHRASTPKVGQTAPGFQLLDLEGQNPVSMSSFRNHKPIALVFGSFSWPPFVEQAVSLQQLYQQFHQPVEFLVIYIREAHPVDGWDINSPNRILDPQTIEQRRQVAGECEQAMKYGIRTYVDEMHDPVMTAYAAWPERLYLIDKIGKIAYVGGEGPFGFKPSELREAIAKLLEVWRRRILSDMDAIIQYQHER